MPKPQSKTQKKIDNSIRLALSDACEQFLVDIPGFQWLTHHVNYSDFPASLLITCVFDTRENQQHAEDNSDTEAMQKLIQARLINIGVKLKAPKLQIIFDDEESRG